VTKSTLASLIVVYSAEHWIIEKPSYEARVFLLAG